MASNLQISPAKSVPCPGAQAKVAEVLEDLFLQQGMLMSNSWSISRSHVLTTADTLWRYHD